MLSIINDTINGSFLQWMGGSWLPRHLLKMYSVLSIFTLNKLCLVPWVSAPSHSLAGLLPGTLLYQNGATLHGRGSGWTQAYLLSKGGKT